MIGSTPSRVVRWRGLPTLWILLAGAPQLFAQGSVSNGEALFAGRVHFRNGAPACASCHRVAGSAFPGGGTMGPDLTREYTKLGPQGLDAVLQTLYFPAMNALFGTRPLTPEEQQDVRAYLESVTRNRGPDLTAELAAVAAGGFLVLLAITWRKGRGRVRSVRRALMGRAAGERRWAGSRT